MTEEQIMDALRNGDAICVTHRDPFKVSDVQTYYLVKAARKVGKRQWTSLQPKLEPATDGLFGVGQTCRLKAG